MLIKQTILLIATLVPCALGLSAACQSQAASLALGDLGACLQLTSLLPVLSDSGSIVSDLNTYLTTLCLPSTPTCSNSTISSAQSSLSSCASDIAQGGSSALEIEGLMDLLAGYPFVYAAACAKNSTTNEFCVTSTLNTIQSQTNTNITISFITTLLSPVNASAAESQIQPVIQSGQLCTGCVQTIYEQALKVNSSVAQSTLANSLNQQCGADFASGTPTGVNSASVTSTAGTSAAHSSGTAMQRMMIPLSNLVAGGAVMVAALVFGGSLVL